MEGRPAGEGSDQARRLLLRMIRFAGQEWIERRAWMEDVPQGEDYSPMGLLARWRALAQTAL